MRESEVVVVNPCGRSGRCRPERSAGGRYKVNCLGTSRGAFRALTRAIYAENSLSELGPTRVNLDRGFIKEAEEREGKEEEELDEDKARRLAQRAMA